MSEIILQSKVFEDIIWIPTDSSFLMTFPIASFAFNLQPYIFPVFFESQDAPVVEVKAKRFSVAPNSKTGAPRNIRKSCMPTEFSMTAGSDDSKMAEEIPGNTENDKKRIVRIAMFISFGIYMMAGLFGFIHFGKETDSNILLNYDQGNWLSMVVNVITIISVLACFPLNVFPLRALVDDFIAKENSEFYYPHFAMETAGIIGAAFVVKVLISDIAVVIGITGATACTIVAYLSPIAYSAKLQKAGWTNVYYALFAVCIALGCISLGQIVFDLI